MGDVTVRGINSARLEIDSRWYDVVRPHIPRHKRMSSHFALSDILDGWEEGHRVYHSTIHLARALRRLKNWRWRLTDREFLEAFVALILHDAVYEVPADPNRSNEQRSADLVPQFLADTGLDRTLRPDVIEGAILATAGHSVVRNKVEMVVCWCDLWDLAGSRKIAERNSANIEAEYRKFYTAEQYVEGRREFLRNYQSPFHTYPGAPQRFVRMARRLNRRANRNLKHELATIIRQETMQ